MGGKQPLTEEKARAPSDKQLRLQVASHGLKRCQHIRQLSIKFVYTGTGLQTILNKRQMCGGTQSLRALAAHHVLVSVRGAFLALAKTRSIFTSGNLARKINSFEVLAVAPIVQKISQIPTEECARNPKRAQIHIHRHQAQGNLGERWTKTNSTFKGSQSPIEIF